jgi:hypothetical protein
MTVEGRTQSKLSTGTEFSNGARASKLPLTEGDNSIVYAACDIQRWRFVVRNLEDIDNTRRLLCKTSSEITIAKIQSQQGGLLFSPPATQDTKRQPKTEPERSIETEEF